MIVDILKSIATNSGQFFLVELLGPEQAEQGFGQASPMQVSGSGQVSGPPSKLKERPLLKDALIALLPIANKWRTIGILLDMRPHILEVIAAEQLDERDRLREMIHEWLNGLDANWENLIEAVNVVNEGRALEILRTFLSLEQPGKYILIPSRTLRSYTAGMW